MYPMHAIRQKCRPKHQVLILKCYPRTTKGAVDVKPNSSELSYLLYYATTRRSKVQKVGAFLEKKTASDVWRARIGNVQVTLQILAALIEKAPRDLPLYAPYVLKILGLILYSGDITMVESSIPTFEAFCHLHDGISLSADQEYLSQYEEIVRMYATFASTRPPPTKAPRSAPVAMRWRVAGLQAVKSLVSSEALSSVTGSQLDVIMPILLENLWTDNYDCLEVLEQRAEMEDKVNVEKLLKRRASITTVRTVETSDTNPAAVSRTTADADKMAEEDIGVLAIQCLKQIFVVNNRSQVRMATIALFKFTADRVTQKEIPMEDTMAIVEDRNWATIIFLMIARWTPVQDRYVILVTAMEKLIRNPMTEEDIPQQLVLAIMIDSLLKSDINLIGLSVMDVLLGLIQHILKILQLNGVEPHRPQRTTTGKDSSSKSLSKNPSPSTSLVSTPIVEITPSTPRKGLLNHLQQCIGDLATHVYYADQASDMISAILLRLKPSPLPPIPNLAAAVEEPEATTNVLLASTNLVDHQSADGFFSFATAKITALNAIKSIILVATRAQLSGGATLSRNRVGLQVWEGTQWLLRDPDGRVRKAYVDALLTWLDREVTAGDLPIFEDRPPHPSHKEHPKTFKDSAGGMAKRAVSSASHREKSKPPRTTFFQLLHLAIYDNALQFIHSEADIILLHLLLTMLVQKLGVNAVISGLPMIFRLQEDIQEVETIAKVRLGSLCHGYFWALSETFDFEGSGIGREIQSEIIRRRDKGIWVNTVSLPPMFLDHIGTPGQTTSQDLPLTWQELESESLQPYDDRSAMIELISVAYSRAMAMASGSPPTSPSRSFSHPILSTNSKAPSLPEHEIPVAIRDQMLTEWSRDAVIARIQEVSKAVSLNGSKAGTGSGAQVRTFLAVNGNLHGAGTNSGTQSPGSHQHVHRSRPPSAYALLGGIGLTQKLRKSSPHGGSLITTSDSSRNSVTRVEQLKRVLSGQAPPSQDLTQSDNSSESMVSYDAPISEHSDENRSPARHDIGQQGLNEGSQSKPKDRFRTPGEHLHPLASNPVILGTEGVAAREGESAEHADIVPPVLPPPLALGLVGASQPGGSQEDLPISDSTKIVETSSKNPLRSGRGVTRALKSRGGQSHQGSAWAGEEYPPVDLGSLLKQIDTERNGHGSANRVGKGKGKEDGDITKPPY